MLPPFRFESTELHQGHDLLAEGPIVFRSHLTESIESQGRVAIES